MILPCAASDRADGPDRVPAALAFSGTDAGIQQPVVEGEEQPGVLIHGVGVAAGHPLGELVPMPRWGHRARAVLPVEEVVTAGTVGGLTMRRSGTIALRRLCLGYGSGWCRWPSWCLRRSEARWVSGRVRASAPAWSSAGLGQLPEGMRQVLVRS